MSKHQFCNDDDININVCALLHCVLNKEEVLSSTKVMRSYGLYVYDEEAEPTVEEDIKTAEEYLGEKLITLTPGRKRAKKVPNEAKVQMNRLYHELNWSMDRVGALYGLTRWVLRYYITEKREVGRKVKNEGI